MRHSVYREVVLERYGTSRHSDGGGKTISATWRLLLKIISGQSSNKSEFRATSSAVSRDVTMTSSAITLSMLTLLCVGVSVTSADGGKCVCLSVSVCVDNELPTHDTIRYDTIRYDTRC